MSKDNFLDDIRSIDDPDMQEVAIFDVNKGEEIYRGTRDDMPSDIKDLEVLSIDTLFFYFWFSTWVITPVPFPSRQPSFRLVGKQKFTQKR